MELDGSEESDSALERVPLRSSSSTGSLPTLDLADMSPRTKKKHRFSLGRLGRKSSPRKNSPRDTASEPGSPRIEESPRSKHQRKLSLSSSRRGSSKKKSSKAKDEDGARLKKALDKIEDPNVRKSLKLLENANLGRLKNLYDLNVAQADEIERLRKEIKAQEEVLAARNASTYRQGDKLQRPASSNAEYYPMYAERPPAIPGDSRLEIDDSYSKSAQDEGCACTIV